ncbi:hypothetical protein N2152v2_002621 [Parachlorella kessleri]
MAAFNPGQPRQLAPNLPFDQEAAAKADILGAVCTAAFNLINNVLSSRTGQVASPWFYLLWSTPVILLPVVARWAFGEATNQTEAAFGAALAMADGKYQAFADVLDWPFAPWVHAPLEARLKVSDAALCAVVLAWSHIAFAGVGSTMVVLAFQRWQAPATGRRDQLELVYIKLL